MCLKPLFTNYVMEKWAGGSTSRRNLSHRRKKRNKSIKIRSALFLNVAGPSKVILFKFLTLTVICIHVRIHLPQKILDLDSAIVVNQ